MAKSYKPDWNENKEKLWEKQFFKNVCWTDGSGFEFDGEPNNLVGYRPSMSSYFSMEGKMAKNLPKGWNLWSNWIDKFQTDYRFLLLSDTNAETILQPNVDDPWMFTEYVFVGTGIKYAKEMSISEDKETGEETIEETIRKETVEDLVIEPPLYNEETLLLTNPDRILPSTDYGEYSMYDYSVYPPFDYKAECSESNRYRIISSSGEEYVKSCRQVNPEGWGSGFEVNDAGVKLYKVTLNVESVKWGEHGNIPPHTLNMFAPPDWINVKTKKTITPVTVAKVGYPIYSDTTGMYYHDGENDYVVELSKIEFGKVDKSNLTVTYNYNSTKSKGGVLQSKGEQLNAAYANKLTVKYIQQCNNGDIVHEGCEFFKGNGGKCACERFEEGNTSFNEKLKFDTTNCTKKGGNTSCIGWVQKSPTVISSYETVSKNKDEYIKSMYGVNVMDQGAAAELMAATPTGAILGAGLVYANVATRFQPGLTVYNEPTVWYETTFKVTEEPEQGFVLNPEKPKDFGKGTKVVRGSGYQVIDNTIPWQGGDNYAVGDMDQVNYTKFMQSVMPCYHPDYCNELCGVAMQSGYDAKSKAGTKTQNSPDAEGVFLDYCRYYHSKEKGVECPYGGVPKTAYEFQEAQIIAKNALTETINRWVEGYSIFEENGLHNIDADYFIVKKEMTILDNEVIVPEHFIMYAKNDVSDIFGGIYCGGTEQVILKCEIIVKFFNEETQQEETKTEIQEKTLTLYKVCKFTLSSINPVAGKVVDIYFWWNAVNNSGESLAIWFCKMEENTVRSTHFTHYVDNWNKFIGGHHPEYKDYSKHGSEYIQKKEQVIEDREGMGDLGGDPAYSGVENPVSEEGYWTDADGEWIMDERNLKENLWLDENDKPLPRSALVLSREKINGDKEEKSFYLTAKEKKAFEEKDSRTSWGGISYSQTNTSGSGTEKKSPRCKNCAVYDNDTAELLEALRYSPPEIDEDDKKVKCPPSVGNVYDDFNALPSQRVGAYCPICDYYAYIRYIGCNCPHCGSVLEEKYLRKYYKLKSIGQVDVWGLPGTVIKAKSYFWKNPTLINQALLDQICFKAKKNGSGANSTSELTGGYINETKGYYKPVPEKTAGKETEDYSNVWGSIKDEDRDTIASFNPMTNKVNTPKVGFDTSKTNDQLIVPYSDDKGLKFLTISHVQALRKVVEPALGYMIGEYPSNPDYERKRPTYENRTSITVPKYWTKGRCGIKPQILAANDVGKDFFIQYYSGDPEVGSVREYFPPGTTWWMINNRIGCRYTDNNTLCPCHMDTEEYGKETNSMMCVFLHGFLPLNKKIKAAYAVIRPASDPARPPFGISWNGVRIYYDHYHAFTQTNIAQSGTRHEMLPEHLHLRAGDKYCVYDDAGDMIPYSAAEGSNQYNAGNYIRVTPYNAKEHTWKPGAFTSEKKRKRFERMVWDSEGMPHYKRIEPPKYSDLYLFEEPDCKFMDDGKYYPEFMDYKVGLEEEYRSQYEYTTETYSNLMERLHGYFDENWYGKLVSDGQENEDEIQSSIYGNAPMWGYIKLEGQYEDDPKWTRWGKEIVALKTKNELWKNTTTDEFKEILDMNTGDFYLSASDGENEVGYDFSSMNNSLITNYLTEQLQEIPGYFNYSNLNTYGSQNGNIKIIEPKPDRKWTQEQIIYQDDSNKSGNTTTADKVFTEAGNVARVLDITSVVKEAYEKRMECKFGVKAGRTIKEQFNELKSYPTSQWEGVGAEKEKDEREKWNKRTYINEQSKLGMLLSDDYHYPVVDSATGNIKTPSQYEKYERSCSVESNAYVLKEIKNIKVPQMTITVKNSNLQTNKKTFEAEETVLKNENEFVNKLETMFNSMSVSCSISILSDGEGRAKRVVFSIQNCKEFKLEGVDDFLEVSSINETGNVNRIISNSGYLPGSHPMKALMKKDDGWSQVTYREQKEYFVIDLLQMPFEKSRRDWRHRIGTKDCSNCYCPNENCPTQYPKPQMVGVWAKANKTTMGQGQTRCPSCGSDLSNTDGVVSIDSDGINSYFYEGEFVSEPLLSYIETTEGKDMYRCNYKVMIENRGVWNTVLDARYDEENKKYNYTTPYTDGLVKVEQGKILFNTDESKPIFRSRYIRVEAEPKKQRLKFYEQVVGYKENLIYINRTDIDTDALKGQVLCANIDLTWNEEDAEMTKNLYNGYTILGNYIEVTKEMDGEEEKEVRRTVIKLDAFVSNITSCTFYANKYYSGLQAINVYGIPYKEGEMTITPKGDIEKLLFDTKGVKLSNQPIQIQNVWVGGVKLTEVDSVDKLEFVTQRNTIRKNGKYLFYYTISSGTFYYSIETNSIYVSPTFIMKDTGWESSIYDINNYWDVSNIVDARNDNQIDNITVEYWSGKTGGVTLPAHAVETGPAYQLDAECICEIPKDVQEKLPDCGMSVPLPETVNEGGTLKASNIKRRKIEWFCYNHVPSTLNENQQTSGGGYFRKPTFYGTELGKLNENISKDFIALFGEHCTAFSQRCETQVTFYGKPNMILSGGLAAVAPEKHEIQYYNSTKKIVERTGGLANGCFVLRISKGNSKRSGRKTKAWCDPLIVVYAEDIDPLND